MASALSFMENPNANPDHDKAVAFYSAIVEAWITTRMERDRALLNLSTGGLGLVATLLTAVGPTSSCALGVYIGAGISFLAAIILAVTIFDMNADHLREVAGGHSGDDPRLKRLDFWLFSAFLFGLLLTTIAAIL